jgi:glycosyltransferase involved in cell wall biosynthesis
MRADTPITTHANDDGAPQPKPLLVCFSHLKWDFVYQRPQHLMTRAAQSHRVVFFEEPIWEDVPRAELVMVQRGPDLVVARPVLPRDGSEDPVAVQRRLLDGLLERIKRPSTTFWYYTPMALPFSRHARPDLAVYDKMDELSLFRGAPRELVDMEEQLLGRVDLVFTGGRSLYEASRHRHAQVFAFPSSIDAKHFGAARDGMADPADQAGAPRPRFGFFGVIDERMDVDLVGRVAELRPDWQLMMIGPVVKIDPANLPRRPNVHWLGQKDYAELPAYLANWDVGFMPFALNESTRFISPTKTPEFLAAGLPVISTPITDVVRPYGEEKLVSIAGSAEEVVALGETALAAGRDKAWLRRVDRKLAQTSWDATWAEMASLMAEAIEEPAAVPAASGASLAASAAHV